MRPYKVLYELVKKELITQELSRQDRGICRVILLLESRGIISEEEEIKLYNHLQKQKPSKRNKYKNFTLGEYWVGTSYWWGTMECYPETRAVRAEFLNAVVNNLK